MAKLAIKKASTDQTVYLFIQASNVTTGAGLTGLTFETASLVASYVRPLGTRQAITLATLAAADSAHSDGGFKEVDATNMPGVYRLDLPDAVCATGVNSAVVMLKGAANMAPVLLEIQLASVDVNDSVRLGMTALPNAAADAAGGLPISDAGGLDLDAQIKTDIDAIKAKSDQLTFTVANKVDATATVDPTGIATSAALAVVDANVDAIKLKTDALDVSSVNFVTSVSGSTITVLRGDTLSVDIANLGSLASYVSLDFTVKRSTYEADDDAIIRIRKNASGTGDGLIRLNGAAHTTGTDGSITITDAPTGDVTLMLKAGVTDDLVPGSYVYDIQLIEAAGVTTLTTGGLVVTADVTRLVA